MRDMRETCIFIWKELPRIETTREWRLMSPSGAVAATVWDNGTWHSWDRNGVGGENDVEENVAEAKRQAFAAVAIAGYHEIRIEDE